MSYANVLVETRDNAASWQTLGTLPSDFEVETLEVAPSDPHRIYVSGTASENPLLGVIERSDDGGASWTRTTLELPPTRAACSSARSIPSDPGPALGARAGARRPLRPVPGQPAASAADKGASFAMLGATTQGMLGFALSPDGNQLAYGGPVDGLFVGPLGRQRRRSSRSATLRVRCLRWNADGLYACGTEPQDPFSVGRSTDQGATFEPIYSMGDTCPQLCAEGTSFASSCEQAWAGVAQRIAADGAGCAVPWARPRPPSRRGAQAARKTPVRQMPANRTPVAQDAAMLSRLQMQSAPPPDSARATTELLQRGRRACSDR